MTNTTAAELLAVADRRARDLIASNATITLAQWEAFDDTLYRALHLIVGPGRKLTGCDPGITRAVITTFKAYPQPIRPVRGETYSAVEAARLLGTSVNRVTRALRGGELDSQLVKHGWLIDADELDTRPDVTPATGGDPNPLARLSVALGGLADVLTTVDVDRFGGRLTDDRHTAAAVRHVLSIASVVARYALTHLPITEAARALRIAQYTEQAVDALAGHDAYPQLGHVASNHPRPTTGTLDDRLEVALEEWTLAARDDLRQSVPSVDVLRNIMSTGVHILATSDAALKLMGEQQPARVETIAGLREQVRTTALALHAAGAAWEALTTAMTPSLHYTAATRETFSVLASAQATLRSQTAALERINVDQAVRNLSLATDTLAARMVTIDALAGQLLGSHLLFIRARAIQPRAAIIDDRAKGRLVVARPQDVPKLGQTTREARERVADLSPRMRGLVPSRFGLLPTDRAIAASGLSL